MRGRGAGRSEREICDVPVEGESRKSSRFSADNPPPRARGVRYPTTWSAPEVAEHVRIIEGALRQGATHSRILALLHQQGHVRISKQRVGRLVGRIQERWQIEDQNFDRAKRAEWKSGQIRRLTRMRDIASGSQNQDGTWAVKPDHRAVARYEELLAKIQGTLAPIEIDLDVRYTEAMMVAIGSMSAEQMASLLAEAEQMEAHARQYRAEHPELVAAAE